MQTHRSRRRHPVLSAAVVSVVLASGTLAVAGTWDLNLGRLCQLQVANRAGRPLDCGGGYDRAVHGEISAVLPDNAAFRSLMSELGVLFAPNILAPAETYGYNGFSFAVEFGFSTINPKKNATNRVADGTGGIEAYAHRYWRAAESVSDTAFSQGDIRNQAAIDRIEQELPPAIAPTVTVMMRKGLWLPTPSFELGVGARHLIDSRMWAAVVEAKLALHEGYQGLPLPALAVRGTGSRVFNTPGFSLTVAGLDVSMSKHLGVASTFNLMPYVGYQLLWVLAFSEVVDATPGVDGVQLSSQNKPDMLHQCLDKDCNANFTFDEQTNILRHRFFIGMRTNFYLVSFLLEYSYFAAGQADDTVFAGLGLPATTIPDEAGAQHSINFAVSLDW